MKIKNVTDQNIVCLIIEQGKVNQRVFEFTERTHFTLGRDNRCSPIHIDGKESSVSQNHCEIHINPPRITIRDIGSLNGTKINGELIGKRGSGETREQSQARHYSEYQLHDGDIIELASAVRLRVQIQKSRDAQSTIKTISLEERNTITSQQSEAEEQVSTLFSEQARNRALLLLSTNEYEVGDLIGSGEMGFVLKGNHIESGIPVAIKLILPRILDNNKAEKRFHREIQIHDRLRHLNIVATRKFIADNGYLCIVMDYCNGGSLEKWINNRKAWPTPKRAVGIILAALQGLEFAHENQVVHRDLKPGNILMQFDSQKEIHLPKIADFGLAKALDEAGMTTTGSVGGTLGFMPRQQLIDFKHADPEVDVWAMAAILYWLLTHGQTPRSFPKGKHPVRVVLEDSVKPIEDYIPSIAEDLVTLINQALIDKPHIRIRTAKELRLRLEEVYLNL